MWSDCNLKISPFTYAYKAIFGHISNIADLINDLHVALTSTIGYLVAPLDRECRTITPSSLGNSMQIEQAPIKTKRVSNNFKSQLFATHLATLRLETPGFLRPLICQVINCGEDLWSYHPMRATAAEAKESLLVYRAGYSTLSQMVSRTPLSNHLSFVSRTDNFL